ncbi:hypothetical protein NECAME_11200 [Necator americanus]|uniref:Uncharacterized protein n=1 Tax=Necator americanus TaxID=51031 RepID=W2T6I7_NECAM|nr:hypothetical protein NECAME_11200 [Necator americanus]ETN77244.1 hypothetical protein NECAME_11200 [Necator americanus]
MSCRDDPMIKEKRLASPFIVCGEVEDTYPLRALSNHLSILSASSECASRSYGHTSEKMLLYRICIFSLIISTTLARRGGGSSGRGMSRARSSASHRRSSSPRFTRKFSKVGSIQRTSMFRATVFGAAAGYLTFRAGRHFINDPSKPIISTENKLEKRKAKV